MLKFDKNIGSNYFYVVICMHTWLCLFVTTFISCIETNVKCYWNFIKFKIIDFVCTCYEIMKNVFSNK